MLSRRDLVGKIAASAAVLWAAGTARASLRPADAEAASATPGGSALPPGRGANRTVVDAAQPETASAQAPWEILAPLTMGAAVAHGWRVAGLTGAVDGTCVLTLENARGRSHRIHMCRNAGRPQGVVYTEQFDLVVMNGGQGDLPTDEGFAQAVAQVAHVLSANENRRGAAVVASLMPHEERLRRFAGADRRLR